MLVLIPFTPSIGDIRKARVDAPAQVMSSDGKLLAEFKPSNREWVALADISPHMVDALIATEDHRFYEHHGLDWRRTAGAALHTFSGDRQGGSTITQQLARNLYPDEIGRAPTLTRKVKEAITALKIEAVYSKPQILETYLNTVPFLYNAYGVEMAARTYFDKSADQLDVLDSATLVGMLKGNSYYNPVINPERALQRRNTVLGQMVKYGKLTPAQFAVLQKKPLRIDFERQKEPPGPAPHFAQQLRKWLIAWADRNDYNIYSDGLIVRTTIDSRLQSMATAALKLQANQLQGIANGAWNSGSGCAFGSPLFQTFMRETPEYKAARDGGADDAAALKALGKQREFLRDLCKAKADVQAGFMAIDPRDGAIRAWVGSRDFGTEPFDHVQQARRQPGSTFKAFVYGAAFADGAKPTDTFIDQPVEIPLKGGEIWRPDDAEPPTGKPMTLADALAYSRNRITAQLMQQVGPVKVARLAREMGVRDSPLEAVPSLALGTSPVTLKEMVSAYATIANVGELCGAAHGDPHRGSRRQRAGRVHAGAAGTHAVHLCLAHAGGGAARRDQSRHRLGDPHALRDPRRRGRQDRHHPGQHRRLVHPDAAATGGGRVGRLRRRPRDARSDYLGAGRAQRPADGRRFLPARVPRQADRRAGEIRYRSAAGFLRCLAWQARRLDRLSVPVQAGEAGRAAEAARACTGPGAERGGAGGQCRERRLGGGRGRGGFGSARRVPEGRRRGGRPCRVGRGYLQCLGAAATAFGAGRRR